MCAHTCTRRRAAARTGRTSPVCHALQEGWRLQPLCRWGRRRTPARLTWLFPEPPTHACTIASQARPSAEATMLELSHGRHSAISVGFARADDQCLGLEVQALAEVPGKDSHEVQGRGQAQEEQFSTEGPAPACMEPRTCSTASTASRERPDSGISRVPWHSGPPCFPANAAQNVTFASRQLSSSPAGSIKHRSQMAFPAKNPQRDKEHAKRGTTGSGMHLPGARRAGSPRTGRARAPVQAPPAAAPGRRALAVAPSRSGPRPDQATKTACLHSALSKKILTALTLLRSLFERKSKVS